MKTTKPQPPNRKQIELFLASARNKAITAEAGHAVSAAGILLNMPP